jgi:hypothetical protein
MPVNTLYYPGQTIRITGTFQALGINTDPVTITFTIKDPNAVETSYTYAGGQVVRDAVGVYHYDLLLSLSGNYFYRVVGTGTASAAWEDIIVVSQSHL